MDNLVVPFIFVARGEPEPKEWLALHPGAIKIPARLVPRPGAQGNQTTLQFDLNAAFGQALQSVGGAGQHIKALGGAGTQAGLAGEAPFGLPDDDVVGYLPSRNVGADTIESSLDRVATGTFLPQAGMGQPTHPLGMASETTAKLFLASAPSTSSNRTPAQQQQSDIDAAWAEGVDLGANGKAKEMMILVVNRPDGTRYTPMTRVKNPKQAKLFGVPIGTLVPIPVPKSVNPEKIVDEWKASWGPNPVSFAEYWWPKSKNDYKVKKFPHFLFDSFGNFEYGATGAAAGFPRVVLRGMAQGVSIVTHHELNNPVNQDDVAAGFDAIHDGGTLSTQSYHSPDLEQWPK